MPKDEDCNDSFVISLSDGFRTRAFGDGSKAANLRFAIYHGDEKLPIISTFSDETTGVYEGTTSLSTGATSISLELVHDESYVIVFWADSYSPTESPYKYNDESKSITVDYSNAQTSDEGRDAFWGSYSFIADGGTHNVKLSRAMAQINVGTADIDDAESAGVKVVTSNLEFSELATQINLVSGKCSGSIKNVKYGEAALPEGEIFPAGTGMQYLGMAYVLVGTATSDQVTIDVDLKINGSDSSFKTYTSIPVRKNYRTNLFGKLLTSPDVFTVTIDSGFEGSSNETGNENKTITPQEIVPVKRTIDGKSTDVYSVENEGNLLWLSEEMKAGQLRDIYIELAADLDMKGCEYAPLEDFSGTLDGQMHKISNLSVKGEKSGLIGNTKDGAVVKNLTIENSTVETTNYGGAICGKIEGFTELSNCKNVNTKVIGTGSLGGIVGYSSGNDVHIMNCSNSGTVRGGVVISGIHGGTGGILGCNDSEEIEIKSCENTGNIGSLQDGCAGGIVGRNIVASNSFVLDIQECKNTGNVSASTFAGGIYGGSEEDNKLDRPQCSNNSNSGSIKSNKVAGGIMGMTSGYVVIGNSNTGSVNGAEAAGGVAGHVYAGEILYCTGGQGIISAGTTGYKGRLIGVVRQIDMSDEGINLSISSDDDGDYSSIPSVGFIGSNKSDTKLKVNEGTLYGKPSSFADTEHYSYIVIVDPAIWDVYNFGGFTWKFKSGDWEIDF